MTNLTRFARRALGAATALTAALATPASAQQIERIITFGDSYADQGNAFRLGYANPQVMAVYPTGRFSGGVNYIDVLSDLIDAPVVANYAVGGALGGVNTTTLCSDPVYGAPLCGKGFQWQVDQYLAASPGALTPQDLVTVSIGGNDARVYQLLGGPLATAGPAGAGTAAVVSAQLDRIVANGSPTISYIGADAGLFPEIALDPAGAAIRSAYSASFNAALQQTLAGYAANGSIVHYLDTPLVFQQILANPGAYGITNGIVCPPAPNLTCLGNSTGYLFYLDGLHLTSQGMTILAQYVAAQVEAPVTLQAPADIAADTGREFGRVMSSRLDLSPGGASLRQGLRLYVVGDGYSRRVNATVGNEAFRSKSYGATLGAEYGFGAGALGVAVNLSRPRADFGNAASRVHGDSTQVGAYAGGGFGNGGFVQAYAGAGWDSHHIDRRGVVEGMTADPKGTHWLMGAKAGYLMPMGGVGVGPVATLDYVHAKVDGYTESGDPALTLKVSSQRYRSLRGALGLEARVAMGDGDSAQFQGYLGLLAEKALTADHGSVVFAQTSTPIIVNSFALGNESKKLYARLNAGGRAQLMPNAAIDAGLTMTLGKKGDEQAGHVGLTLSF